LCKKILLAESKLNADTEKNADTEIPKELDTNLKIIWLDYQNNYVENSNMMSNDPKSFYILTWSFYIIILMV